MNETWMLFLAQLAVGVGVAVWLMAVRLLFRAIKWQGEVVAALFIVAWTIYLLSSWNVLLIVMEEVR